MNKPPVALHRYVTVWHEGPEDKVPVAVYYEGIVVEISPSGEHVRVVWGRHPQGHLDQEWIPTDEFHEAIVDDLTLADESTRKVMPGFPSPTAVQPSVQQVRPAQLYPPAFPAAFPTQPNPSTFPGLYPGQMNQQPIFGTQP